LEKQIPVLQAAHKVSSPKNKNHSKGGIFMITALVLFKAEKGKIPGLANQLGAIEEVVEVLSITGEHDLIAKIQVRDYEKLSDIVTEKMQNTEGVLETKTMMAFKTYKFHELAAGAPTAMIVPPST
jgi:anthranilate phosphoribosyltransferase